MRTIRKKATILVLSISFALFASLNMNAQSRAHYHKEKPSKTNKIERKTSQYSYHTTYKHRQNPRMNRRVVYRALPRHAQKVYVNNRPYFYYNQVFFQPVRGGFVMVTPPAIQPQMPQGTYVVCRNNLQQHCYNGVFYLQTPYGYVLINN